MKNRGLKTRFATCLRNATRGSKSLSSMIDPPIVASDGWPSGAGGIVHDVPGLYFVGLLFQRGFYSMLIGGAGRDAKFIASQVAARGRSAADMPVAVAA